MKKETILGAMDAAKTLKELVDGQENIKEVIEMFSPVISEIMNMALDVIGPETHKVMLRTMLGYADVNVAVIDRYIDKGCTREEAISLLLKDMKTIENIGNMGKLK